MKTRREGLDANALACLADARAYPHDPSATRRLERIDTHISHVFLTAARAYKFRRAVRLAFLDFSRAEERDEDCLREVRLNRRLAHDVYLGVAPLRQAEGRFVVGACGEALSRQADVVEHCVVMRRLPAGRDLHALLAAGTAGGRHIDAVASRMAAFHAEHGLGVPAPFAAEDWLQTTTAPARANFAALLSVDPAIVDHRRVREVEAMAADFTERHAADFEERRRRGRVVDGHGDLHAEHVWFESDDAPALIVDCLEFRDDFRRIDAASDVSFLAMDLTYRGRADLAARFLRRYARESGDFHLFSVVDYFAAYRALVRAKVAALVAADASMPAAKREGATASTERHLELGRALLEVPSPGPTLLMCGLVGSGKSTVAELLADALGAVVISSDRVRKMRAGRRVDEPLRAEHGGDAYDDERRSRIYEELLAEATAVVRSGRTAILDATYGRSTWRRQAAAWAERENSPCSLVEVRADERETLARLSTRAASRTDPSDAGPEVYARMRAEFEAPEEWTEAAAARPPRGRRFVVDTAVADWERSVREMAATLATQARH